MAYVYPYSGSNTYVPSFEASGSLVVNFSRNPNKFPLNKYIGVRKVEKDTGYYLQIKSEESARVINSADYVWADGERMPEVQGVLNNEAHNFVSYQTRRYVYPFALGQKSVQQASWNIIALHAGIQASKAMTHRTMRAIAALTTGASWASNTGTASSISGGVLWGAATTSNLAIKKSILTASQTILQSTNGVVQPRDLMIVINPNLAAAMAETDEIHNMMKGGPFAMSVVKGENDITEWGLPSRLYGIQVVIEDTVKVTSKKLSTTTAATRAYALGNNDAIILARPDGLDADGAGPTFNTLTCFAYEEFTAETKDDVDNRRTLGRVVEDTVEVLTAPASGYYITNCQS